MPETKKHPQKIKHPSLSVDKFLIHSEYLERLVTVDVYLPQNIVPGDQTSILFINDGQDLLTMDFKEILRKLMAKNAIDPLVCVGIHCGDDRMNEYGTACRPDYKGLGSKAGLYKKFVFDELIPFIRRKFHAPSFKDKSFAGFSLGGLSAFDIVWNEANQFSKLGVFSGSLWWRRKAYEDGYNDEKDRIMHLQVRMGDFFPWLKFYLQTGKFDETADRNNNGIIDSIDDALDMIVALKAKGYTDEHITYNELIDGRHDVHTWARALPDFLLWGWGKNDKTG